MNRREFLKPTRTKFILFFFLAVLTFVLLGVMFLSGTSDRIPSLMVPIIIMGWIMISPFVLVTVAGLFLGNLLGESGILMVPVFSL